MISMERKARRIFCFTDDVKDLERAFYRLVLDSEVKEYMQERLDQIKEVGGITGMVFLYEDRIGLQMTSVYTGKHIEKLTEKFSISESSLTEEETIMGHLIFVLNAFADRESEDVAKVKAHRNSLRQQRRLMRKHEKPWLGKRQAEGM